MGALVRPVVLANEDCNTVPNTVLRLAGWGLNEHSTQPENLKQLTQTVISQEDCIKYWGKDITGKNWVQPITNSQRS
jgi:hypothetical protein